RFSRDWSSDVCSSDLAVRLPNGPDYVRLLAACGAGGLVLISVNTRYSDAEAADLVARSGARATITEPLAGWSDRPPAEPVGGAEIGRASCRERAWEQL